MRLKIVSNFFFLAVLWVTSAFAYNFDSGYDKGPLLASEVKVDCTQFSSHLLCTTGSVQQMLNQIDQFVFSAGSASLWAAGNVGINTTVNVGIGSTAPGQKLDVQGTVRAISFSGDGSALTGISTGSNYWNLNQNNVGINTTGGNVGIGTVTPQALLEIETGTNQDIFRVDDSAGTDTTPFIIEANGNVGVGTATPSAVLSVSSTLVQDLFRVDDNGAGDLSPFLVDKDGNVGIGTANTQADKLLVMGGNVGIGTWIPSTTLDIKGTTVTTGFRLSTGPSAGTVMVGDATGLGTWMAASTLPITSSQWATQNTTDVSLAGGNVGVGTTLTTNAALTVMNGNVGIGTWKPVNKLDVNGGMVIGAQAGTTPAPSNGLFVSGNVGIGTTSTANALSVTGGVAATGGVQGSSLVASSGTISAVSNGSAATIQNSSATSGSSLSIQGGNGTQGFLTLRGLAANGSKVSDYVTITGGSSATEIMRLVGTGGGALNVGIGTAVPLNKLAVVGTVSVGSAASAGLSGPTNGIYVEGNVGINTITPGQKLDVQGTVRVGLIGATLAVVSGTNACHGTAALSSGTVTVSTACTPSLAQNIFLTDSGGGVLANIGALSVGTVSTGTSFVINSANALDSSNVGWLIIN